ncbi:glycosyltransferase family 2 protein [Mangrovibacterium sp.]|uniref:glycosyltransferase n=1 Tax=Mangrovibacterium sp. TaxID=1961364 RepID=UPI0035648650
MIYIAYFIVAFYVIQLLVALSNLVFVVQLKPVEGKSAPLISVLIPARNEEKNIGVLLSALINQEYQNIEIIVFNDVSTDRTSEVVAEIAKTDQRITLINSENLPSGWLGKNFACHSLSKYAKGKYLLFLDADVQVKNSAIANSIALAVKYKSGLLSIFPKQKMKTIGERLTVPNMNYILLSLLPLALVRNSKSTSLAAANGQFMLFESETYFATSPHEKFKDNKVEDINIARYYKNNKISVVCLPGDDNVECRMYNSLGEAVNGFSKNVTSFFGNSYTLAIVFWLITTFGLLAIFYGVGLFQFYLALTIFLLSRIVISIISRQNMLLNLVLLIPQQLVIGLFIAKAIINKFKNQSEWKGRTI